MENTQLEEGEACYYKDDTSVDPDIALSCLDEKLHSVLGHFQKDFEGGVSAENLGAKFGGYGSFLPTYQRSPSVQPQSKTPQRVQNFSSPRSHDVLPIERAPQNSTAPSDAAQSLRASTPTSVDPDIALSYLDEKLHSVLGHFQKDFEGGVSAENLGAKFGGYGSFLATYQRSLSVRPQSKTPQRVQNFSSPRSHDVLPIEVPDEAVSKCTGCGMDFNAFVRKHHCRNCGDIFCDKCTRGRIALTSEENAQPVRVCDRCMGEVTQRLNNAKEAASKLAGLQTHEDLAKKLQEEMERNRKASSGSKSDGSGRRMKEVACPTCTVHLQVQVPSSGSETIECGVCQQPFLVSSH